MPPKRKSGLSKRTRGQAQPPEPNRPPAAGGAPPRPTFDPGARVVAVTGAYSFMGAELIRRLEEDRRYYKVLAIDIRKPAFPLTKTQFHRIDLTLPTADAELAGVLAREGAETFVHAAFLSSPTHHSAWAHELENIGTIHVLNACSEVQIRKLVVWSSTLVYGADPLNPNFLSEEHPLRTHESSRFINDKVEAEREVKRFADEHPETVVTVLRTAATLGPRVRNYVTRFFSRPACPTLMGYDPLLQFLHENDAIDAFKIACDEDCAGPFNIVGHGVLPYSTILAMMGKVPLPMPHFLAHALAQALWATQLVDAPASFLDFLRFLCVADGSRAHELMGFRPRYDIKSTILDFLGMTAERPDLASEAGRA